MNQKNIRNVALSVVIGLGSISMAQAATYNYDLLVGFTTGSGNDVIYDLGDSGSLFDGKQWNLSTELGTAGQGNYSLLSWGVVGVVNSTTPDVGFITSLVTPGKVTGQTMFNKINNSVSTIYSGFGTAGSGQYLITAAGSITASWYNQTTIDGALGNPSSFLNAWKNPNIDGLGAIAFYQAYANNSAVSQVGTFTFDNSGILTYNGIAPVPEPSTFGLMAAGSGLMVLFWRNKLRRNLSNN